MHFIFIFVQKLFLWLEQMTQCKKVEVSYVLAKNVNDLFVYLMF